MKMSSSVKMKMLLFTVFIINNIEAERKSLPYNVKCSKDHLMIAMKKPEYQTKVYLDKLNQFPGIGCDPQITEKKILFDIKLNNDIRCGTFKIKDAIKGEVTLHNKIIIEDVRNQSHNVVYNVECVYDDRRKHNVSKRNVLPAGFREIDDIEATTLQTNAPKPILNVVVKQGSSLVNGELNVKPGTPLTMEISLDKESAPIYGLLVGFMRVSDTKLQEETIIFNGCSLDPYLFENFNTVDGDTLSARFRAFKFPETTYVQFTGTVSVCLDKCSGIECSNGQIGYGRKKRETSELPYDPKKIFEVTLTTYIKVEKFHDKETPERIFKEKQFSQNYKILDFNESHIVPLEDLFQLIGSKNPFVRDSIEDPNSLEDPMKDNSLYLKPSYLIFVVLTWKLLTNIFFSV